MTLERVREKILEAGDWKDYPAWFRKVLARRLLLILLPYEISSNLPRWLSLIINAPIDNQPPDAPPPSEIYKPPAIPGLPLGKGKIPPIYTPPFTPGPPKQPAPSPVAGETTVIIKQTDGSYLQNTANGWDASHDAASSSSLYHPPNSPSFFGYIRDDGGGDMIIGRHTFLFDLSGIPAGKDIVSAKISIWIDDVTPATIIMQTAAAATGQAASDYGIITGDQSAAFVTGPEWQTCTLTAAQLAYVKSKFGSNCLFISRDYDHDVLDVAPSGIWKGAKGKSYADADADYHPYITIVYK